MRRQSVRAIAALCAVILCAGGSAFARDNGQWAQVDPAKREWFRQQQVPSGPNKGKLCCDEADGQEVQEDIRDGRYWIKGGRFSEWTLVPDEVVIRGPNKHGQPVVWSRLDKGVTSVYCFAPGAGI